MQTITFNSSNISAYIFEDSQIITSEVDKIVCPDSFSYTQIVGITETIAYTDTIIQDMNSSNSTVHTDVTPPGDWAGGKYLFDGTTWTANPDYTAPPEDI